MEQQKKSSQALQDVHKQAAKAYEAAKSWNVDAEAADTHHELMDEEDDFLLGRHASVSESEFGADEHSVAPRTCRFTDWVVRRTWLIAAVVSLIALTCTIVAFAVCPPNVDLYEHSDAFTIGNHPSVEAHKMAIAFYNVAAENNMNAHFSALERRDVEADGHAAARPARSPGGLPTRLVIVYRAKGGKTVLTAGNLRKMRELESRLQSDPQYQKLCTKAGVSNRCIEPYTAVPFYFPSLTPDGRVWYDGQGQVSPNIELTTQRLFIADPASASYFFDPWAGPNKPISTMVRSSFTLGQPGQRNADDIMRFMKDIRSQLGKYETRDMQVVWAQEDLLHAELKEALVHDSLLILVSVAIIFAFLWLLLDSLFLALAGMFTIALSVGTGYFFYRIVFQISYFGAVNLLVVFVCLGIAVDDIFVVVNAFKQTKHMNLDHPQFAYLTAEDKLRYRLGTSYSKSANAVFLTSFTTAAAVLTNLLSPLAGVRTFVSFMATIVISSYALTVTLYPCAVVIYARHFEDRKGFSVFQHWPDITRKLSDYLADVHAPFFLSSWRRRAVVFVGLFAVLGVSIALICQLTVNGGMLKILRDGNNYQSWIRVRDYYGNLLSNNANCDSCSDVRAKLEAQLSAVNDVHMSAALLSDNGEWAPPVADPTLQVTTTIATVPTQPDVPLADAAAPTTAAAAAPAPIPTLSETVNTAPVPFLPPPGVEPLQNSQPATGGGAAQQAEPQPVPVQEAAAQVPQPQPQPQQPPAVVTAVVPVAQPPPQQQQPQAQAQAQAQPQQVPAVVAAVPQPSPPPAAVASDVDCNTVAVNAATRVLQNCQELVTTGKCNSGCAMALDTSQTGWERCKGTQTAVGNAATQQVDWAIKNCHVEAPVVLVKTQMLRVYLTWGLKGYAYARGISAKNQALRPIFDPAFDFYDPQTQTDMLDMCEHIANNRELSQNHRDAVRCFMPELRDWAVQRGYGFPLPGDRMSQNLMLMQFLDAFYMWKPYVLWDIVRSSDRQTAHVGAVNVLVWTPRKVGEDSSALMAYYQQWTALMDQSNARSGPRFHGRQSAQDWENTITKMSTVTGIVWSIGLSALIAGLTLLLFSQSPRITLLSMFCLLSNTVIVLGLVRVFGWSIGMLEALSLSILLGLAVDYLLHVSEEYALIVKAHPAIDRYTAVRQTLRGIGASVTYSAITTCGSVVTLVFAQLSPIQEMGIIVFCALVLSIVIALIPYAAMLVTVGPVGYKRTPARLAACAAGAVAVLGLVVLALYVAHLAGVNIVGPAGFPLF